MRRESMKKVFAGILAAGMILSMPGMTNLVYAAEPESGDVVTDENYFPEETGEKSQVAVKELEIETGVAPLVTETPLAGEKQPEENRLYAENTTTSVSNGGLAYGVAYALPDDLINYTSASTCVRQYVSQEAGGVYFLRNEQLQFLNVSTGVVSCVYNFPVGSGYFNRGYAYEKDGILYWASSGTVVEYDLDAQKEIRTLQLDNADISFGIGVDAQGQIYLSVCRDGAYYIQLYAADGTLLDSTELEGPIYEFAGFGTDGGFYYIGYHNWLYWGYEHDMKSLIYGKVEDGKFVMLDEEYYFGLISNLCQLYYYEYQDCAAVLGEKYLADKLGNVYDITGGIDAVKFTFSVPHNYDEEPVSEVLDDTAIGTRMIYQEDTDTLIAYASGKWIYEYDLSTKEKMRFYQTSHYVFNLLDYGDSIVAIEKENGVYYVEWINKDDLFLGETTTINLNESDTYASHTKDEVLHQWEKGYITSDTKVYESTYSLSPYQGAVFTDDMKDGLLRFSNYMRWLGGLTPFESAEEEKWEQTGKGAVLLTAINEMTHEPSQPENMDDAYYQEAYDACSNSNLYSVGIGSPAAAMNLITGWTDDTANVSAFALGHRFTFLKRSADKIAYGSAAYALQNVEVYNNQINTTGTVTGVDNNDYAYTWPGAGYFPTNAISTRALWSINLNSDLIDRSSTAMTVTIKDMDTGEIYDVTDSLGSSAYMGFSPYWGYFHGECFYFSSPEADSYDGKNYQVTIGNLELANGLPAEIVYTVSFFTPEHAWGAWESSGTSASEEQRTCAVCGEKETRTKTTSDTSAPTTPGTDNPLPTEKGWYLGNQNQWYYVDDSGAAATGWQAVDGTWYYFNNTGVMQTGWQKVDGNWYYMDGSGAMVTGWQFINGLWYYFYGDGSMAENTWIGNSYVGTSGAWVEHPGPEGWKQSGSKWWYQYADGTYAANTWRKIGGIWYYFDAAGWMCTGWVFDGSNWYYMNADGSMKTGWLLDGNTWYYLNTSGAMATGWVNDGGTWYLMDSSGAMKTGWAKQGEEWYYMNESGAMQTGWLNQNGTWYYLYESGAMAHDTIVDGFFLGSDGAWMQGFDFLFRLFGI
ncbi:MAG: hypothetical protein ACI4DO_08315 [Roseburia sp.]